MDRDHLLIQHLSDGEWHSGENLAGILGVSRAAVWKRLQALADLGVEVESRHGKGYRLAQPLELLEASLIRQAMPPDQCTLLEDVAIFPSIASTNDWLMQQQTAPAAAFAEHQSAGRGRRGRQWHSPFGANLYFSLAWRFATMPPQLPALSLAVGVTLAQTLRRMGAADVGLKWPNDLQWQGRKLAGILIEHRGEAAGPCRIVVGVGLNLVMSESQGAAIDQHWTALAEVLAAQPAVDAQAIPSRNALAGELLSALVQCLQQFSAKGFAAFQPQWAALDVMQGRTVRVLQEGVSIEGVAQGVDRSGALLLQVRGERQRIFSGEVSLREVL